MMTFLIAIHVTACIVLIVLVLIQRGRGAGLVESFAGVESMFGTRTSVFLTRTTTIMSIVFFITCLALAVLSVKQSKSLMRNIQPEAAKVSAVDKVEPVKTQAVKAPLVNAEPAKVEPAKPEATKEQAVVVAPAVKVNPDAAKAQ